MANPTRTLNAAIRKLEGCSPALSTIRIGLDNVHDGDYNAYRRCMSKTNEVRDDLAGTLEDLRKALSEFDEELRYYTQRGDDYKARYQTADDSAKRLTQENAQQSLQIRAQGNQLANTQHDLDQANDIIHDRDVVIAELRRHSQQTRPSSTHATAGTTGSGSTFRPGSAGRPNRLSSDSGISGISDASCSTTPEDHTRYTRANGLYEDGVKQYQQGHLNAADTSFARLEQMLAGLPSALRQTFDTTELAYYRAVCLGSSARDAEGERILSEFLRIHYHATKAREAHIRHLLAVKLVKLNKLEDAFEQCCTAVGLWDQDEHGSDHYFDAVSLLVRITHLQKRPTEALAMINQCPEDRKDYVRNKYTTLTPTILPTAAPATPIVIPIRPATTRRVVAPAQSTNSSTSSGRTSMSAAERRRRQVKQLPMIFRMALT
ncbi:hypothetical protein LTR78_006098 [Recurvomyces mirabilis]|uniref:Uncharacterized protein n=1 Tax=Recurvomyces mirabilis TaxID=574656 RepID=A0AAE1C0A4_9PEZI|nr:hypothetical protein LTR78_006098 [Recurvomyces mirabilis]KAK5151941.1 hypothetical protein LTS14_008715 [Recurvomyces mirabilis]